MNTQFKKGVMELCVLALLNKKDCYGYDVSEYISKVIDISDGTIYPILRKLKNDGLVSSYLSEISGGPPRKYYSLTDIGREKYKNLKQEWNSFANSVMTILEEHSDE
jgi:PadR family transcriptional regulator PadR